MKVEELLIFGKTHIHSDLNKILLSDLLNLNPLELLNHLEDKVDKEIVDTFKKEVIAIEEGKPIQYALKNVNFYGNKFFIDKRVLIPRFETEELVENSLIFINDMFKDKIINILDIGCGSGVIGLTMKIKHPQSNVDLIDISKEALEVANINKKSLNIDANIYYSDIFSDVNKKYDVIISNPPYIKENEKIEKIVADNEPSMALYGGSDGLDYYRKIIDSVSKYLNEKFLIAFEIGYDQKEDIINIINKRMKNVEIIAKKDMSLKDRMIFIKSVNKI